MQAMQSLSVSNGSATQMIYHDTALSAKTIAIIGLALGNLFINQAKFILFCTNHD